MKGLNYKTYLNQYFFNFPLFDANNITVEPFQTLTPNFTGVASDFNGNEDLSIQFAPYQCTSENTNGFENFNIALSGYLYTGNTPGIYNIFFDQNGLFSDDLTYFYFGDNALNPTTSNVDQATTFVAGGSFSTPSLDVYTYYPVLIYYGQSFGGGYLPVGVMSPNDVVPNYSPDSFVTDLSHIVCFLEGSMILCHDEKLGDDIYLPIETLRPGSLVKTSSDGYLPIDMIGITMLDATDHTHRFQDRLYKCPREHYPELFQDLIITGSHSILVDTLTTDEKALTKKILGKIFVTRKKYRLMAFLDSRTIPYEHEETVAIWHFALSNPDYYSNYGVYANGLLVETCSRRNMNELSNMTFIQ